MLIATIILGIIAIILLYVGYSKGQGQHIAGMKWALNLIVRILPLLIFAFIIAGMVQILIPQAVLSKWVGTESGWRGIIIGTIAGGLTPGGPYVSLPVAGALLGAGAGIGTMVAFVAGWSIWGISRLPLEVSILGWKVTLIRFACTFFFPPIAGFLAHIFFSSPK